MDVIRWGFKSFKADPRKVWEELQTIGEEYTPYDVLEYAEENPDSELHKCFTWTDEAAAYKWRVQEARWICNSLTVVVTKENKEPQSFRLVQHDTESTTYRPVIFTVRDPDQYNILLRKAKEELKAFRKRYAQIVELREVVEAIESVL